jgi:hypothetical protein
VNDVAIRVENLSKQYRIGAQQQGRSKYKSLREELVKAAHTETVMPGMHADFDRDGKLLGLEVLDASDVLQQKVQFEVTLTPTLVQG